MGILKHLLFWPVTGPEFLTKFAMGRVHDVVRDNLTDDSPIKEELLELQLKLEAYEIDDEEYMRREAELMERLREVRRWREEFGMGVSGGPVRVAAEPDEPPAAEREPEPPQRGGPASPSGAEIELNWDE